MAQPVNAGDALVLLMSTFSEYQKPSSSFLKVSLPVLALSLLVQDQVLIQGFTASVSSFGGVGLAGIAALGSCLVSFGALVSLVALVSFGALVSFMSLGALASFGCAVAAV